jgi:hypothetical protein
MDIVCESYHTLTVFPNRQKVNRSSQMMTSVVLTWQRQVVISGSPAEGDWSVIGIQPTTNKWHLFGKWLGATWPSHGMPRGTTVLVNGWWKIFYGAHGI